MLAWRWRSLVLHLPGMLGGAGFVVMVVVKPGRVVWGGGKSFRSNSRDPRDADDN